MRKVCSKCGVEKEVGEFSKKRGGLRSACKACVAMQARRYREENPELVSLTAAKSRVKNKDARLVQNRTSYKKNRDNCIASVLNWQHENAERYAAARADYRSVNADTIRDYNAKYVESLPDAYIRQKLDVQNPTPETINTKRTQLKIIRKIKEIEKFNKQKESK